MKVSLEIEKCLLNNTPHLVVTCLKAFDANVEYFTTFKLMLVLSICLIDCLSLCSQFFSWRISIFKKIFLHVCRRCYALKTDKASFFFFLEKVSFAHFQVEKAQMTRKMKVL